MHRALPYAMVISPLIGAVLHTFDRKSIRKTRRLKSLPLRIVDMLFSAIGKYLSGDLFGQEGSVLIVFKINFKSAKQIPI